MAIELGDAVLTFRGDQTDLDAAFASVPDKAQASFGEATKYVIKFNEELDGTGDSVAYAGEKIMSLSQAFRTLAVTGPENLKNKLDDAKIAFQTLADAGVTAKGTLLQATAAVLQKEIAYRAALGENTQALQKQLEDVTRSIQKMGGTVSKPTQDMIKGFHESRGAVDLLSESIGIGIPRELKKVISELPGVSAALETAFPAAAIIAFIGLLVEVTNKIIEYREKQRELQQGWADYRLSATEALVDQRNKTIEAHAQLLEMTNGPLAAMDYRMQHLQETGRDTFESIKGQIKEVQDLMTKAGASPIFNPINAAAKQGLDEYILKLKEVRDATIKAFKGDGTDDPTKVFTAQLEVTSKAITELQERILRYRQQAGEMSAEDKKLNDAAVQSWLNQLEALMHINEQLKEQLNTTKEIEDAKEAAKAGKGASIAVREAQEELSQRLAQIELLKTQQEAAFNADKINATQWAEAQKKAANDAAAAQLDYDRVVVQTFSNINDHQQAQAAQAKLTTDTTLNAARQLQAQLTANKAIADAQIEDAKNQSDARIAAYKFEASEAHAAYLSHRIDAADWLLAEKVATDGIRAEEENLIRTEIQIYTASGQLHKAHQLQLQATKQEMENAAKALDDLSAAGRAHHDAIIKVMVDWDHMLQLHVEKEWEKQVKSAYKLAEALDKLKQSQAQLNDVREGISVSKQEEQIQFLADMGVLSEKQAREDLKTVYQQEEADRLQYWNSLIAQQNEKVLELRARLELGIASGLLSEDELNDLKRRLAEAEAAVYGTEGRIETIKADADSKITKLDHTMLRQATKSWNDYFTMLISGSLKSGTAIKALMTLTAQAIGQSVQAAVMGSQGMAAAMTTFLKSFLAAEAGIATVKALHEWAEYFSCLADPFLKGEFAGMHLAAALKWTGVAAACSIGGSMIPVPGGSGGGGNPSPGPGLPPMTSATTAGSGSSGGPNVTHLATGGLVSSPTLAVIGDSLTKAAGAREAILPLSDSRAMGAIADALADTLDTRFGAIAPPDLGTIIQQILGEVPMLQTHYHIKGDLIDHGALLRKQNRLVKKGMARNLATDAFRVTRRS